MFRVKHISPLVQYNLDLGLTRPANCITKHTRLHCETPKILLVFRISSNAADHMSPSTSKTLSLQRDQESRPATYRFECPSQVSLVKVSFSFLRPIRAGLRTCSLIMNSGGVMLIGLAVTGLLVVSLASLVCQLSPVRYIAQFVGK